MLFSLLQNQTGSSRRGTEVTGLTVHHVHGHLCIETDVLLMWVDFAEPILVLMATGIQPLSGNMMNKLAVFHRICYAFSDTEDTLRCFLLVLVN